MPYNLLFFIYNLHFIIRQQSIYMLSGSTSRFLCLCCWLVAAFFSANTFFVHAILLFPLHLVLLTFFYHIFTKNSTSSSLNLCNLIFIILLLIFFTHQTLLMFMNFYTENSSLQFSSCLSSSCLPTLLLPYDSTFHMTVKIFFHLVSWPWFRVSLTVTQLAPKT